MQLVEKAALRKVIINVKNVISQISNLKAMRCLGQIVASSQFLIVIVSLPLR